jgi:hypothetical protein
MKAKRYMKPPSCRKPATVTVPYAGPALDGQRPTRTISEPRIYEGLSLAGLPEGQVVVGSGKQ